jgi:hypothetical protein
MTSNHSHQSRRSADEKIGSLFQPDTLLVEQYLKNFRRKISSEPETTLMLAVLEDAINCFRDNVAEESEKKKRLFEAAEQWILADDGDWVFSFQNTCEVLGFSPEYVREGLIQLKEQTLLKQRMTKAWSRQNRPADGRRRRRGIRLLNGDSE